MRTVSFDQLCDMSGTLIGRVVEQTGHQIIRRGVVTQVRVSLTRGSFAKAGTNTLQLVVSFLYWDKKNKTWTQTAPPKASQMTQNHVALYEGAQAFIDNDETVRYGSVIIYPPGQVPDTPTIT